MKLYLLRHAIAEERDPHKHSNDSERPLTDEGRKKMLKGAQGMKAMGMEFDLILTSPFVRAKETAEIVQKGMKTKTEIVQFQPLASGGGTERVLKGLVPYRQLENILLVGHEPDLTSLMADLILKGQIRFEIELKKGGLVRIDFDSLPDAGKGKLIAFLPPRALRTMAD